MGAGGIVGFNGVVLVHGANHSAACWGALLSHLSVPAIAVDLPGRGSRPADLTAVTLTGCVQAVIDSADEARLHQFVLVGHSLGGLTITETAWQHPERVSGLVYVAGAVPAPGQSAAIAVTGVEMPLAAHHMPEEAVAKQYFGNGLTDGQWTDHWKAIVPESVSLWNSQLSGYPEGVPMTYVSMTDDVGVPPDLVARMIANLGAGVEHRVLHAGHSVMVSKPQDLAAIINDVVSRLG